MIIEGVRERGCGRVVITLDASEAASLASNCRGLAEVSGDDEAVVELELRRASDKAEGY